MFRFDLKMIHLPYTISVMQHLNDSDIESTLQFAQWMENKMITSQMCSGSDVVHSY